MWFGPMKGFQKLFFHTPLVNVFILGSEVYHDYLRWPNKDKRTFQHWLKTTHWGKLFQDYTPDPTSGQNEDALPVGSSKLEN
jgi:hypothetical protein